MAQLRNVCFTWNNPGADPIPFDCEKMHYLVYQREKGDNGTEHYQGYCELKKPLRLNQIKTLLGSNTIHCEKRRGTGEQASDYCQKEESRVSPDEQPKIFGTMKVTTPGQRNDVIQFKDAIRSGKRKRDLIDSHTLPMARFPKFYQMVRGLEMQERTTPLKVYLLIGPPGCGKTRSVYEAYAGDKRSELFRVPLSNGTMWFDGYDGQEAILFDDFAGAASKITLVNFLSLIDQYPISVPVKGEFVPWCPSKIFITTNIWPREWFKWENRVIQYQAMARRFHAVFDFYEHEIDGDPPVGDNDTLPYIHESYITHGISLVGCSAPPRYQTKDWWIREKPEDSIPW